MLGTLVNTGAILFGSLLGLLLVILKALVK